MGFKRSCNIVWLSLSLFFSSSIPSNSDLAGEYLDLALKDLAFKSLARHRFHTGSLRKATLPANLSAMEVSVVRLRSSTLWSKGANFSHFYIPPRSLPTPYSKRVFIVYQDLGNLSPYYYNVPGYSLITSVVGFMVYMATNSSSKGVTEIGINTMGMPLSVHFLHFSLPKSTPQSTRCAAFRANGTVSLSDMSLPNECQSRIQGHFAIVAPMKRKQSAWDIWLIGSMVGFLGLVLLGVVGVISVKRLKVKKIHEMERQADEEVFLETVWIGSTKMPSATVTRTHPVLEDGGLS